MASRALVLGEADASDHDTATLAIACDRVARTVYRTVLLARRPDAASPNAHANRTAARKRIVREVEGVIERLPANSVDDARPGLKAEFADRLQPRPHVQCLTPAADARTATPPDAPTVDAPHPPRLYTAPSRPGTRERGRAGCRPLPGATS